MEKKQAYSFRRIGYETVEHILSQTVWANSEEEARQKLDDFDWESWHESGQGMEYQEEIELESIEDWDEPEED